MNTSYFSMRDMQTVWENGGQDAYFAVGRGGASGGVSMRDANMAAIAENASQRNSSVSGSINSTPKSLPGQTFVKDATVKGGGFWRKTGQNLMNTGKGALGLGDKALKGTAGLGSRAVNAAGEGVVIGGMQVRRLGQAIGNNPRAAGAVILGGTVLGAGGVAYSRRDK